MPWPCSRMARSSSAAVSPHSQPNGTTQIRSPRNNLARVNPDGTLDNTFDPEPNGQVSAIAVQPNGQILIGGEFTTLQPNGAATATTRNHLARLNADGSLDTSFNPNILGQFTTTGQVYAIAIQANGQILIGGAVHHDSRWRSLTPTIARLNSAGSVDPAFKPMIDAQVDAIYVQSNGQILIGGAFTDLGAIPVPATATASAITTQTTASGTTYYGNHLGRLNSNGTVDQTFDPDLNNQVTGIAVQLDGEIVIAGYFSSIQSDASAPTTADFIARLNPDGTPDGSNLTDPNWNNPAASAGIQALALQPDGKIVIGGSIGTISNGGVSTFVSAYAARLNPDGTPDTTFIPGPNYLVNALAVQPDGKIVMGGQFTQFRSGNAHSGTTRNALARVNGDGTLDGNFDPNAFGGVGVFVTQSDGKILIGGSFSSVDGITRGNMARLNTDGSLDTAFNPNLNGPVAAIALQSNGQIIVGGNFTTLDPGALGNPISDERPGAAQFRRLARQHLESRSERRDQRDAAAAQRPTPGRRRLFRISSERRHHRAHQHDRDHHRGAGRGHADLPMEPQWQPDHGRHELVLHDRQGSDDGRGGLYRVGHLFLDQYHQLLDRAGGEPGARFERGQTQSITTPLDAPGRFEFFARLNADGSVDANFPAQSERHRRLHPPGTLGQRHHHRRLLHRRDAGREWNFQPGQQSRAPQRHRRHARHHFQSQSRTAAVRAMALQANGRIVIGGSFSGLTPNPVTTTTIVGTTVTTTTTPITVRQGLARINADGSLDTNFDPEANGSRPISGDQSDQRPNPRWRQFYVDRRSHPDSCRTDQHLRFDRRWFQPGLQRLCRFGPVRLQ